MEEGSDSEDEEAFAREENQKSSKGDSQKAPSQHSQNQDQESDVEDDAASEEEKEDEEGDQVASEPQKPEQHLKKPKTKPKDPVLDPITIPRSLKKHFDTNKELNSKTKGLDGILNRDYTPAHLTKAVEDIDTYANKLDRFVSKQEAQTKKLIGQITEYNQNLKTIFDEYDVRKSYHDNMKHHMTQRKKTIK